MNNKKLFWIVFLCFTLILFCAMFYIGIGGLDRQGIFTIRI